MVFLAICDIESGLKASQVIPPACVISMDIHILSVYLLDFCCLVEKQRAVRFNSVIRSSLDIQMSSFTPIFKTIREVQNKLMQFLNPLEKIVAQNINYVVN